MKTTKEEYESPYCEAFYFPLGLNILVSASAEVSEFEELEDGGEV